MITALERHRSYRFGIGPDATTLVYIGREFPDDHPPTFHFLDKRTGETHVFLLPQLTQLEREGALRYGPKELI